MMLTTDLYLAQMRLHGMCMNSFISLRFVTMLWNVCVSAAWVLLELVVRMAEVVKHLWDNKLPDRFIWLLEVSLNIL
jgi:hypothetical protein